MQTLFAEPVTVGDPLGAAQDPAGLVEVPVSEEGSVAAVFFLERVDMAGWEEDEEWLEVESSRQGFNESNFPWLGERPRNTIELESTLKKNYL